MADTQTKEIRFRAIPYPIPEGRFKKDLIEAGKSKDPAKIRIAEAACRAGYGVHYCRPEFVSVQPFGGEK